MPMMPAGSQTMEQSTELRSVLRHLKSLLEWPPLLLLEEVAESTEMPRGNRHLL